MDDVWGIILLSIVLALITALTDGQGIFLPIWIAFREIGGAVALGIFLGRPAASLTGRLRPGQPMMTEALGLVLFCDGLALLLDVSFLISSMVMGCVIRNFAKHHEYAFHEMENIEWPFMIIFFVLAGAALEINGLTGVGMIGPVFTRLALNKCRK